MFLKFFLRDAVLITVAITFWKLATPFSTTPGPITDLVAFMAGALMALVAYLLHEWGHLIGALLCGSRVDANAKLGSGFTFRFDARENSLTQFLVMSTGGFIATALVIWSYYSFLPAELLATRIAIGGALFMAFLGVSLELPLVATALLRRTVPKAVAVPIEVVSQPVDS
jgi:hypothetical protein